MAEAQAKVPVKFQFQTGETAHIEIEAVDGKKYKLRLGVVVFNVNQVVGLFAPDGTPAFEIGSGLLVANEDKKPDGAS